MRRITTTFIAIAALAIAAPASASLLLSESFPYADGDLTAVSAGLWTAHSGAGTGPIQVVGGKAVVASGSEDVNRLFSAVIPNTDRAYACFELTVTPPAAGNATSSGYFAHFRPDAGFAYSARLRVEPPQAGGNFTLGIHVSANATGVNWPSDLAFNQTYKVAIMYDPTAGSATLWVDPTTEASQSVTHTDAAYAAQNCGSFALRQFGQDTGQVIDNLQCGTTFADVCPQPTPTIQTTFGKIKALYR